jgi:hypothetical protein
MRRLLLVGGCAVVFALSGVAPASADLSNPQTPIQSCFGIAAGQRASALHDLGEHTSSFPEPRTGIGNLVFRVFGFSSVGEAGSFLASVDDIDATHCPA